ncbi:hypothetical protein PT273_00900 [Orbaceae bacterium ESL0727]|nr:hypothetical protein [Orbaceae bacterium ESL0727]
MSISSNKRIIKNTLFLYIRMFLILAITLYTSRIILKALGIEDYGIYTVVAGFISLFTFLNNSMSSAVQRFFSFEIGRRNLNKLQQLFNCSLIIYLGIAIIIFVCGETIGLWFLYNKISIPENRFLSAIWVYHLSICIVIVQTIQIPFNALIIAREQMHIYAFIGLLEVMLKLLIVYILLIVNMDKLKLYAILSLIITLFISISYISFCYVRFKESHFKRIYNKVFINELITYSGWSLFGNIAAVAKGQGINVLLNIFFGALINAAYGITSQLQNAISLFMNNFLLAINPQIIKNYSIGEKEHFFLLINKGSRFSFIIMSILITPIIYNIDYVLYFWLKIVPTNTNIFVILSLICLLIESLSGSLMTGIQATGKIKTYQLVVGSLLFLNLPVSYVFLYLNYSANSVFIIAILLAIVALFFRLYFLKIETGFCISFFIKEVLSKIVIMSVILHFVLYSFNYYFTTMESDANNFLKTLFFFSLSLVICFFIGLEENEKRYLIYNIRYKLTRHNNK